MTRGRATSVRTLIALDEVQELTAWPDSNAVQHCLAATIKRVGSTVAFVFSGSEKHTIAALFDTPESPLHGLGIRRSLPAISREEWVIGLEDRYAQAGITIDTEAIRKISAQIRCSRSRILYYSHGLPLPTMLICQHTLDWLEEDQVTMATVDQAVLDACRHPSWDLPA